MMELSLRDAFPIFKAQDEPFHYMDSAATSQICAAAAEALIAYETRGRANVKRGVYRLADEATQAFDAARASVAAYLSIEDPGEIVLTSGTTFAINLVAHGLAPRLRPGSEIVLSELEHHSNIVPWQIVAERTGAVIRAIPVTPDGRLDLEALEDVVSERTAIIAVTHVSNVTGAVSDLATIADAAHAVGGLCIVDGAQGAPHGPLDVAALGCDAYAFSGHKVFAATGSGALWLRPELAQAMPPFVGGGEMIRRVSLERSSYARPPHRFEAGTPAIGPALSLGAALRWAMEQDWAAIGAREQALTTRLIDGLARIQEVSLLGPREVRERHGIVTFDVAGVHAHDVCQLLDGHGVALRGGHHCAQPLMDRFERTATVRASLGPYNDEADVDALLEGLSRVIARFRLAG